MERATDRDRPLRVLVLGGGIAGLVAALELEELGHDPLILEAQSRAGGRIHTLRCFADDLYAEAGAMRIPLAHDLTLVLCARFGLELRPFPMDNPQGLVHVGGQRMTSADAGADPDRLGFEVAEHEKGRACNDLWEQAIAEERALVEADRESGWAEVVKRWDQHSLHDFLREKGWSSGAIEMYGVMNFLEADMHNAAVEVLREDLGGAYVDMQEIAGGSDLLPRALARELSDRIRYGAEVHALEQTDDAVTVHFKTEAGRFSETADYAICTLPFSVLRQVEVLTPFSREKQKAIRQLNYAASTKILFQVRERIWEREGITGGATCTDLPVRRLNYPTPDPSTPRGVLLASYTWSQDAARWGAMDEETRLEEALADVEQIHPGIRDVYECGASYAWYDDKYANGAFALFDPGQQGELHDAITASEGRIRFAGEHCSLFHAWIQGAIESARRAARAIANGGDGV
jgi:monoamine oxidase